MLGITSVMISPDHATYCWGEHGLAAISDDKQQLCFAICACGMAGIRFLAADTLGSAIHGPWDEGAAKPLIRQPIRPL
jgi:hypothetical protein